MLGAPRGGSFVPFRATAKATGKKVDGEFSVAGISSDLFRREARVGPGSIPAFAWLQATADGSSKDGEDHVPCIVFVLDFTGPGVPAVRFTATAVLKETSGFRIGARARFNSGAIDTLGFRKFLLHVLGQDFGGPGDGGNLFSHFRFTGRSDTGGRRNRDDRRYLLFRWDSGLRRNVGGRSGALYFKRQN